MTSCAMCGSTRELNADGICADEAACVTDLDELLARGCGPDCLSCHPPFITDAKVEARLRQVLERNGYRYEPPHA